MGDSLQRVEALLEAYENGDPSLDDDHRFLAGEVLRLRALLTESPGPALEEELDRLAQRGYTIER